MISLRYKVICPYCGQMVEGIDDLYSYPGEIKYKCKACSQVFVILVEVKMSSCVLRETIDVIKEMYKSRLAYRYKKNPERIVLVCKITENTKVPIFEGILYPGDYVAQASDYQNLFVIPSEDFTEENYEKIGEDK